MKFVILFLHIFHFVTGSKQCLREKKIAAKTKKHLSFKKKMAVHLTLNVKKRRLLILHLSI